MLSSRRRACAPRRSHGRIANCRIYYGWIIASAGLLGMVMSSPGQTFIISLFTEHFIHDLGLSRSMVSFLYMIGTLSGAILLQLTRMGHHIDRSGPRRMIVLVSIAFGLSCVYMSIISSAAMLTLGFIALRFLGQSSMTLISGTMVNQWWVRFRGRIRGLMGVASSLITLSLLPMLVRGLLTSVGWRGSYVVFGLVLLFIMAPIGYLAYRRRPEDFSLVPDGVRVPTRSRDPDEGRVVQEVHFTLPEAVRTPAFWILALSMGVLSLVSTGLIFHMESIVTDQGLERAIAAMVFMPMGMTQALLRFPAGYLVDKIQPKYVLALALVAQAATVFMATRMSASASVYMYGVVLGITSVAWGACGAVIWA